MQQNVNVQIPNNLDNRINENLFQHGFTFQHFRTIHNNEQSELERYDTIVRSMQYTEHPPNLLQFWTFHLESLPCLAKIALHVLLQPASSAVSERVFSKAKRILGSQRLAMSSSKVSDAIMVASNPHIAEQYII